MSSVDFPFDRVCYVHCNFCNTILVVSVPSNSMLTFVTVRCGHCANLLSVNMGALLQTLPPQDQQKQVSAGIEHVISNKETSGSSNSKCNMFAAFEPPPPTATTTDHLHFPQLQVQQEQPRTPPIRPPEKRQRVPSAYNRFIKEEIQRIKASNPDITHREAFSTAAKNWAHFPHIHFGLKLDGHKLAKLDHATSAAAVVVAAGDQLGTHQKSLQDFY